MACEETKNPKILAKVQNDTRKKRENKIVQQVSAKIWEKICAKLFVHPSVLICIAYWIEQTMIL